MVVLLAPTLSACICTIANFTCRQNQIKPAVEQHDEPERFANTVEWMEMEMLWSQRVLLLKVQVKL